MLYFELGSVNKEETLEFGTKENYKKIYCFSEIKENYEWFDKNEQSAMQPNTLTRTFDPFPEVPVIVGLVVTTFIIIILNAEEVYQKVLLINSRPLNECKSGIYKWWLYGQIGLSALIMYFSVILMMKQKTPLEQLMNLTALWTLNNFDNFFYLIFDMVLMKDKVTRKIITDDKYMKFKIKEN